MKARIKFSKQGTMKFIGHLDIMRYFQKCMRRAKIDIAFSEGFSPHMIMSFAAPLGVGITSNGEYVDIELRTPISSEQACAQLNAVQVEGIQILSFRQIPDGKASKAMSLVAAADYTVAFREGHAPSVDWKAALPGFYAQKEITVTKKTKKSETQIDIRPLIYAMELRGEEVFMQLSTGSAANLKPELVMEAFGKYAGFELDEFALQINREEVYADIGSENERKLVSLEDLGEDIVL